MDSGYLECHGSTVGEDTWAFIVSEKKKSYAKALTKHNSRHITGRVTGSREISATGFRHYLIIICTISVFQS